MQFIISYGKSSKQLLKEFNNNFYYNTTGDTTINELLSKLIKLIVHMHFIYYGY